MKTVCPHCQQVYDVEDRFENMALQCNSCSQVFTAVRVEEQASETNVLPKWWDKLKKKFKEKFFVETICPHCMQFYELPRRKLNTSVTCSNCDNDFVVEKTITCPNCQNICRESETICSVCETNLDVCKSNQNLTGWKKILNCNVDSFFLYFNPPALLKAVRENMENCWQEEETASWKKVLFWPFAILTILFALCISVVPYLLFNFGYVEKCPPVGILFVWFIIHIVLATLPLMLIRVGQGLSCKLTEKVLKWPYYFSAAIYWGIVAIGAAMWVVNKVFQIEHVLIFLGILAILMYSFFVTYSGIGERQVFKIQCKAFGFTFVIMAAVLVIIRIWSALT
ncbi:MAG: hypothetical protein E7053_05320 [Lentisphaerae bacterium]|nr:hypothetical protein [Lentisphaerota bacterium]